jgi:hypothetical protein
MTRPPTWPRVTRSVLREQNRGGPHLDVPRNQPPAHRRLRGRCGPHEAGFSPSSPPRHVPGRNSSMRQPSSSRGRPDRLSRLRQLLVAPVALLLSVLRHEAVGPSRISQPRKPVTETADWAIATSVPIRVDVDGALGDTPGAVTARRHPTGWFISATHSSGMSAEELADFRLFVRVRVHLLLRHGPRPGVWESDACSEQWRAALPAAAPAGGLPIPDRGPDSWDAPSGAEARPVRSERRRGGAPFRAGNVPVPTPRGATS